MCTLIVAWQVFADAPVCVAANRDEAVDRPASPPAVTGENPRVVAPRDEEAGGTWIGYNEHGVFVAVTNRWVPGEGERSRGLLVRDALAEPTAQAAVDRVDRELDARSYAPFHLVVADVAGCFFVAWGGERRIESLSPGVHIVMNVGRDGDWFVPELRPDAGREQAANADRVWAALEPLEGETAGDWTGRAGRILGDHEYGVCIHGDGFGTRSSSLLRLGDDRVYEYADGPPCETAYERVDTSI